MTVLLTTGDENADQQMDVYVQGRSSPMRVMTAAGVPPGLVPPLTKTLFGDAGTAVPVPTQDGSIALPFATLAQIIAATGGANDFSAMLAPGDYGSAAVLGAQELALVGMGLNGAAAVLIGQIACNGSSLRVSNANVFVGADDSDLHFWNCTAGVIFGVPGSADFRGSNAQGAVTNASFAYFRDGSAIQTNVTAADCTVENSSIAGDITCTGTLKIRQLTDVVGTPTLTADVLDIDAESLRMLVFAGATLTANTYQGFTGTPLMWGADAATTGGFLNIGTRVNPLTVAENSSAVLAGRRGVLCNMVAFSNVDTILTARKNFVDTALTVNPNNGVATNLNTFIIYEFNDSFSMAVTGVAGGQAIVTAVFV